MNNKFFQALIGGVIATVIMTMVMFILQVIGFPRMSPPEMLSKMLEAPPALGWIIHFSIGIIFAVVYAFVFIHLLKKLSNPIFRGVIFGFTVFVFVQVSMTIMESTVGGMPAIEGSKSMLILGSFLTHVFYGILVAFFVKDQMEAEEEN